MEEKSTILREALIGYTDNMICEIGTGAAKNGYLAGKAMLRLPSPEFMPKCGLEQDGVDEIHKQLVSMRGNFVAKVNTV